MYTYIICMYLFMGACTCEYIKQEMILGRQAVLSSKNHHCGIHFSPKLDKSIISLFFFMCGLSSLNVGFLGDTLHIIFSPI